MTAQSFQCPACGAPLLPRGTSAVIRCPHCQTSVIIPETLRQAVEADRWSTLVYDDFVSRDHHWLERNETSDYFAPLNQGIADGRYRWEAVTQRASSMTTAWLSGYRVSDFHLSVNCKHILGTKADSSWGLIFRIQDLQNYYWFRMTDNLFYSVSVVDNGEWHNLVAWTRTEAIKPQGVNQLEVLAEDTHFTFLINGQVLQELEDAHFSQGFAGIAIEAYAAGQKTTFDFLDFTLRGRLAE